MGASSVAQRPDGQSDRCPESRSSTDPRATSWAEVVRLRTLPAAVAPVILGGGAALVGVCPCRARGAVDVVVIGPPLNGEERPVTMVTNITMTTRGVNVLFHSVSPAVSHPPPVERGVPARHRLGG